MLALYMINLFLAIYFPSSCVLGSKVCLGVCRQYIVGSCFFHRSDKLCLKWGYPISSDVMLLLTLLGSCLPFHFLFSIDLVPFLVFHFSFTALF